MEALMTSPAVLAQKWVLITHDNFELQREKKMTGWVLIFNLMLTLYFILLFCLLSHCQVMLTCMDFDWLSVSLASIQQYHLPLLLLL